MSVPLNGVLGNDVPAVRARAAAEQFFKGEARVSFGGVAVFVRDRQRLVVLLDMRGGGL